MRTLDAIIWFATGILCILGAIFVVDMVAAIGARACPAGSDCYPWGAEGPAAENWRYASKPIYLASGAAMAALPLIVAVLMFGSRRDRSALVRIFALSGLAVVALLYLA